MSSVFAKTEFIDHFYQFTSESDWQAGIDLYRAGNLVDLTTVESLVIGRIADIEQAEVRIKMHANRRFIQWLECSCTKNRIRGYFCQHIVATVFHLDRENPQLVQDLDLKMLVKPPIQGRKRPFTSTTVPKSVLSHLKGSILEVRTQADGSMVVDVEIKRGVTTSYNLGIDQAAEFLAASQVDLPFVVSTHVAHQAVYLQKDARESILMQKIIVIDSQDVSKLKDRTSLSFSRSTVYSHHGEQEQEIFFVPLTQAQDLVGERYFFLPSYGYIPLKRDSVWRNLADSKRYSGDQAAALIRDNFLEFSSCQNLYLDHKLKKEKVIEDPGLARIEVKDVQGDVFHLSLDYYIDGKKVSLTKLLARSKKRRYLKTDNNQWLKIPDLVSDGEWKITGDGEYIVASPLDIHRLKAAMGEYDTFVGSKESLGKLSAKTTFDAMVEPPSLSHSNLNLRSYQQFGFKWLWWLYQNNLHGLLADEMGLGKTHQAMALLSAVQNGKENFKFLVVCPTTVLTHWSDKISEFAPDLNPAIYHGQSRFSRLARINDANLTVITSYGVLQRDIAELQKSHWDVVVLDEAHYVKNSSTHTYRAACKLSNSMRMCLSGTPFENDLRELKSIFDFLLPGYLGSDRFFRRNILRPIKDSGSPSDELVLKKLIHPFKLRRTKEAVLPDLPDKVIDFRTCTLSAAQQKLYRGVLEFKAKPLTEQLQENESNVPVIHIFAILNLLKQICNHPLLLLDSMDIDKVESGKFELLKELIFEGIESNQKIVIYTQYLKMVEIIRAYLAQQKIKYVTLTGASQNRGRIISQFQTDTETKVFVATLLTGGVGIDLTAASIVIHYDRWWNASKENQATDRVHRIGQNKNVQVFKLITKDTFEEKIDHLIKKKQELFEKYLEKDEEVFKNLTRQELIDLLK